MFRRCLLRRLVRVGTEERGRCDVLRLGDYCGIGGLEMHSVEVGRVGMLRIEKMERHFRMTNRKCRTEKCQTENAEPKISKRNSFGSSKVRLDILDAVLVMSCYVRNTPLPQQIDHIVFNLLNIHLHNLNSTPSFPSKPILSFYKLQSFFYQPT